VVLTKLNDKDDKESEVYILHPFDLSGVEVVYNKFYNWKEIRNANECFSFQITQLPEATQDGF
jgi:hypothetical protein